MYFLLAIRRAFMDRSDASTTKLSESTSSETTPSPSPHAELIMTSKGFPEIGLAVNRTPAASASTMRCTTTAMA